MQAGVWDYPSVPYTVPHLAPVCLTGETSELGTVALNNQEMLASSPTFGFSPSTNPPMSGRPPIQEGGVLNEFPGDTGAYWMTTPADGVSRDAAPDPAATLVALAAIGRNPTDITIPTLVGSEGSGGGAAPAVVLGTRTATSSSTGATKTTGTDSGSHGASGHGNQPPTSGGSSPPKTGTGTQPPTAHPMAGGQAEGSHEQPWYNVSVR